MAALSDELMELPIIGVSLIGFVLFVWLGKLEPLGALDVDAIDA